MENARKAKSTVKVPISGAATKRVKGSWCRVAIPDSHGCCVDHSAIKALWADLSIINPKEIVLLGDHLECGGFLAEHHTIGYVHQNTYSFQDDVIAANQFLDNLISLCPEASIDYLEGNHERRLETWCCTQAKRHAEDAEHLRKTFSADANLSIEKRGIRWIRQGMFYDGVHVPATIKKGHCYFTHGSSTAKHAASVHVTKFGGNIVYGHTHRIDVYHTRTVKDGAIAAWCPGCLCNLQPLWRHTDPTTWGHGYALQFCNPDGTFLHINVPIIDGVSLLAPLASALNVSP